MPKTPNYQFEKRRRDQEKKAKKEEKRLRKLQEASNPQGPTIIEPEAPPPAPDETAAPPV